MKTENNTSLSYAIIGTGAVGSFYGGLLANALKDVTFLARADYESLLSNGLYINLQETGESLRLNNLKVYNDPVSMPKADVVLVCIKTRGNKDLKPLLSPILKKGAIVILVQNGLSYEEKLAQEMPEAIIGGAGAYVGAERIAPGHIEVIYKGPISFSLLKPDPRLQTIIQDFQDAGLAADIKPDLPCLRWYKLVWNVPYNGLTVLLNTATDHLNQNPATRRLCYDLMQEVLLGAKACGITLDPNLPQKMLELTDRMRPYNPSMKVDYDNGRTMEIEAIYTNPIAASEAKGQPLPKMRMLEQALKFLDKK